MDSTYVVWFHAIDIITEPGLIHTRVNARTFVSVEDWAYQNVPDGYELRSIEKHYGTQAELAMFGEANVTIHPHKNSLAE
jgi:hypothetical protein